MIFYRHKTDRQIDGQTDRQIVEQTDRHKDTQKDKQINKLYRSADRHMYRRTYLTINRQNGRQTITAADRWTAKQI